MIIYFNAVRCHPLYVKICQIMYNVSVVQSHQKQNELKAYRATEDKCISLEPGASEMLDKSSATRQRKFIYMLYIKGSKIVIQIIIIKNTIITTIQLYKIDFR